MLTTLSRITRPVFPVFDTVAIWIPMPRIVVEVVPVLRTRLFAMTRFFTVFVVLPVMPKMPEVVLDASASRMQYLTVLSVMAFVALSRRTADWPSPLAAFEAALAHEKHMTANITKLADLAQGEKDHATNNLMQWYVTEQVEEEANVDDIVNKLKMVGTDGAGLFLIDRELKTRTVAPAGGGQ